MRTFRTLFSGGELFGIGAQAAGWRHLDGYEIRPDIAAVACLNGFDVRVADVCDVDYESLPLADHLHASPSCKSASQANTKAGETKQDLAAADAICRAIRAHRGRTFSLENVWQYRNFESFARILHTLHAYGYVVDFRHINAADYGVPQTRKRLILRAVRGRDRVPPLHPTHRRGGDMFHRPWVGWYAATADLIPTLPPTELAPWQLARLPAELRETMLFAQNDSQDRDGNSYGATGRPAGDPALTIGTNSAGWWKAYLVPGQNAHQEWSPGYYDDSLPAPTMNNAAKCMPRAFLVGGQYARNNDDPDRHVQTADRASPSWTVTPGSAKDTRAFLVSSGSDGWRDLVPIREQAEPALAITPNAEGRMRAYAGRWVRLTVQALARFQTVPDDYIGLTAEINGNGVPCLLAQRIMESLS